MPRLRALQVLELRPRFNAIAQSERDAAEDREGPALPDGDDGDTARGMAALFTEAGEAHAIAISTGGHPRRSPPPATSPSLHSRDSFPCHIRRLSYVPARKFPDGFLCTRELKNSHVNAGEGEGLRSCARPLTLWRLQASATVHMPNGPGAVAAGREAWAWGLVQALLDVAAYPDTAIATISFNFWHRISRMLTSGFADNPAGAAISRCIQPSLSKELLLSSALGPCSLGFVHSKSGTCTHWKFSDSPWHACAGADATVTAGSVASFRQVHSTWPAPCKPHRAAPL